MQKRLIPLLLILLFSQCATIAQKKRTAISAKSSTTETESSTTKKSSTTEAKKDTQKPKSAKVISTPKKAKANPKPKSAKVTPEPKVIKTATKPESGKVTTNAKAVAKPKSLIIKKTRITTSVVNPHNMTFGEIKEQGKIWGIDISHYQSDIDWEDLMQQKPHFIFLKASEGATRQDTKYKENYKEAKEHGVLVGSYHFFTYTSSGKDQAKNFLTMAKQRTGDLPLVLDAEFVKKMPDKMLVQNELVNFINAVFQKTGRYPMIYCDYDYYKIYLENRIPPRIKLWIVDYKEKPDCNWTFWQTTDKFRIAGIKGNVDFNLFNGTKKKLKSILN